MTRELVIVSDGVFAFYQFRFDITKRPFLLSTENVSGRWNSQRHGNRARLWPLSDACNRNEEDKQGNRRKDGHCELRAWMSVCRSAAAYKVMKILRRSEENGASDEGNSDIGQNRSIAIKSADI